MYILFESLNKKVLLISVYDFEKRFGVYYSSQYPITFMPKLSVRMIGKET